MTIEALAGWLLAVMLSAVPPGKSGTPAEARESAADGKARYQAIAHAIATATLDPKEPPLYADPHGRARTAALLLAISYYESHWRRDVDLGIGPQARGGGGRYWCMMQIGVGDEPTPEGWTGRDLVTSRDKCFRRALHILQRGQRICARERDEHAFVYHYASGYCDRGRQPVKLRIALWRKWLGARPFPEEP